MELNSSQIFILGTVKMIKMAVLYGLIALPLLPLIVKVALRFLGFQRRTY